MADDLWRALIRRQHDVASRRQLYDAGVSRGFVRAQVNAGRWAWRTDSVLTTTTGPLDWEQRLWLGVLHCGPGAAVGGLTAAGLHGLRNWERELVTVVVDDSLSFARVEGLHIVRTRRDIDGLLAQGRSSMPVLRIEPAVLLFAGYQRSRRTAQGVLAAVVQQGLTTPDRLLGSLATLRPLRWSRVFRRTLDEIRGGSQSVAEMDVRRACARFCVADPDRQRPRRDRNGRQRWTDCEWELEDGRVLVLEVDGGFHLEVRQYGEDMKRQRKLTTRDRIIVRCSAVEIREDPGEVISDLIALGVPRVARAG